MRKILQYVLTYVLFFLVVGIVVGSYFILQKTFLIFLLLLSSVLLSYFYYKAKSDKKFSRYFVVAVFITSFCIGLSLMYLKTPINHKNHYTQFLNQQNQNSYYKLDISIRKVLKPTQFYQKYEANIKLINDKKCQGKILLNISIDSTRIPLEIDQQFSLYAKLTEIATPKNPYTFNYKQYLQQQQIYHQLISNYGDIKFKENEISLVGLASQLRATINTKLKKYSISFDEMAVINALLLGQRQDISKDLMEDYINAGAVHILAVSGLHIGIILLILQFLLRPVEQIRYGKGIKVVLLVTLLWMYAVIAGLSPSVIRAVTMFSILSIGMNLNKQTNSYYTLILSALVLLLANPYLLFDIGFQLSYAAVLSIIVFQPIFQSFWKPKNRIILFYWNVFTVSLAAQLGVLPISLYYFHQFPSLFFVSNLIIIPFLGFILLGGLLVFFLVLLNLLPVFLLKGYTSLIYLMNYIVKWVGTQEQFLIKEIQFNAWMLISVYLILIAVTFYYYHQNRVRLKLLLMSIILFQLILLDTKYKRETKQELIVFHKSKTTVIGKQIGKQFYVYSNQDSLAMSNSSFLTALRIKKGIKNQSVYTDQNVFFIGKDTILVLNDKNLAHYLNLRPSIVILANSPKINLNRLIDKINPKLIVADGSNFTSYVTRWEETCKKTKTPFHHTGQKGAFMLLQ